MKNSEREAQILRIQSASFQPELSTALESKLRQAVVGVTKATLEAALVEELSAERARQRELLGRGMVNLSQRIASSTRLQNRT